VADCGGVGEWLAAAYAWKCGMWRSWPVLEQERSGGDSIRGGDEVGGPGGTFHASASVSRWEKGQDGEHERATIAGLCKARRAREQSVMAHERQARDCNGQNGANAQAIDCHGQVLGKVVSYSGAIRNARAPARGPTPRPLHPRPYNERFRSRRAGVGRREHCCVGSDAPVVVTYVLQPGVGSVLPVAGGCESARPGDETVAAGRGTQEFSGCLEQDAFAQYAYAA
jgi:hypothetical protein